jgi:hypothetical protein
MDASPKISAEALRTFLHGKVDELAETLTDAVNAARPGHLINDSEELVRVAMDELRRAAFEAAVQQKVNAAEAAFSPSGGPYDGSQEKKQGPAAQEDIDGERLHSGRTSLVAFRRGRELGAG